MIRSAWKLIVRVFGPGLFGAQGLGEVYPRLFGFGSVTGSIGLIWLSTGSWASRTALAIGILSLILFSLLRRWVYFTWAWDHAYPSALVSFEIVMWALLLTGSLAGLRLSPVVCWGIGVSCLAFSLWSTVQVAGLASGIILDQIYGKIWGTCVLFFLRHAGWDRWLFLLGPPAIMTMLAVFVLAGSRSDRGSLD